MQTKISRGLYCLLFLFFCGLASVPPLHAQYQQTHKFLAETAGFSVSSIQGTDDYLWAGTYFYDTGTDLSDLLIFRTDANGDIVWSKLIDVSDDDRCTHVQEYPSGAVFTGYAINTDGTRTLLIGTISHTGTVGFIETYEDMTTGRHAEGLHIVYTEADATPGFVAVGMVDGGYGDTDPKSVLLVRVDDGGQFLFSQRYDSPLVTGSTDDFDMGAFVLDMPSEDGFFITGTANMRSNGVGPMRGTLALMVDNQTGAINWVNNYATTQDDGVWEPGAGAVYDAGNNRILNLANSSEHHGFTITIINPATGATTANTRRYNAAGGAGCNGYSNTPGYTIAFDGAGDLVVAGHTRDLTLPSFGFSNTPPFLCRIDLTTLTPIVGGQFLYRIPTTAFSWGTFGGFYAPFPGGADLSFLFTPEMMLPATNGQGYILAGARDEMGGNQYDVEVLLTQAGGDGVCDFEPLCFDITNDQLAERFAMTASDGVEDVSPPYTDDEWQNFTVDCECQMTWPKLGLGTRFFGNDIHVDDYLEYVGGYYTPNASFDSYSLSPLYAGTHGIAIVLDRCGNVMWIDDWDNHASSYSGVNGICADLQGNVYAAGAFNTGVDIQGNPVTGTGDDGLLVSYDKYGILRWYKQLAGTGNTNGTAVQTDASGNVYMVGYFNGQLIPAGGPTFTSTGWDGFIVSYTSSGTYRWSLKFGDPNEDDFILDLAETGGNVYPAGTFAGTANIYSTSGGPSTITSNGAEDWFWLEYDANGVLGSFVSGGGTQTDYGLGVDANGADVVIVGSQSSGTMNIQSASYPFTALGGGDLFAACFTSGTFSWLGNGGGTGVDDAQSVAINPVNDEVYIIGSTWSATGTFGLLGTTTNAGSQDILQLQMDLTPGSGTGVFNWADTYGDNLGDQGLAIDYTPQVDPSFRGVFSTGYFRSSLTMGGTITGTGSSPDLFVSRSYFNGTSFKTSQEASSEELDTELANTKLLAYPNPMQNQLHLAVDEEGAAIRAFGVVDGRGVIVKAEKVNSLYSVLLEGLQLSSGIHTVFVELEDGKRLYTRISVLR